MSNKEISLQERLARLLAFQQWEEEGDTEEIAWEWMVTNHFTEEWLGKALQILSIPDIRRGQELLELEQQGKLREVAENQELPNWPFTSAFRKAGRDMLTPDPKTGERWMKVKGKK